MAETKKQRIDALAKEAHRAEEAGDYPRAASLYAQLAQWEEQYVRYVMAPKAKAAWLEHAEVHRSLASQLTTRTSIWDSPGVKAILEQPERSPIDLSGLTTEEINALARDAIGMWVDHPYIKDSVEWVRALRKSLYKGIPEE